MQYVALGKSGLKVSRICLGCMSFAGSVEGRAPWMLDEDASRPVFRHAVEAGINFFDTANVYARGASEEVTGRLIREFLPRQEAVIATKVNGRMRDDPNGAGLSRKAILNEIDASLRRLGTDYVDLYQIHRWDYTTPIEETLDALDTVVRSGKARYVGASSMAAWQFMKALGLQRGNGLARFISMQNHLNLLYREEEREMLPLCRSEGVGVIPWSPLARGMLTRPWNGASTRSQSDTIGQALYSGLKESDRMIHERLGQIAEELGASRARVALAWVLRVPGVGAPIIGATKPGHLDDAIASLDLDLPPEAVERLEAPYEPRRVVAYQ